MLLTMVTSCAVAAPRDTSRFAAELGLAYVYGTPLGPFGGQHNDRFLIGHLAPGSGFGFSVTGHATPRFRLGWELSFVGYQPDKALIERQVRDRFKNSDYYTHVDMHVRTFTLTTMSYTASYLVRFGRAELEPMLSVGLGEPGRSDVDGSYEVYRKKKNEHYTDTTKMYMNGNAFFYPGAGLGLNYEVLGGVLLSAGVRYHMGTLHYSIKEETHGFADSHSTTTIPGSIPVSAVTAFFGVRFRFRQDQLDIPPPPPEQPQITTPITPVTP